jgi:hypothetical protein
MTDKNHNSLIQEIEDDLARQKYEKLWKDYGAYVIGFAVILVLGTAAITYYKNYKLETEMSVTRGYIELLDAKTEKPEAIIAQLQAFGSENKGRIQEVYALMNAASTAVKNGKFEEGIKIYEDIVANASLEKAYRDLAELMIVQNQLDTAERSVLEARLARLVLPDSIWKFSAMEFSGYLALRFGDKVKARELFAELKDMKDVPVSIAARAKDVHAWLMEGATP